MCNSQVYYKRYYLLDAQLENFYSVIMCNIQVYYKRYYLLDAQLENFYSIIMCNIHVYLRDFLFLQLLFVRNYTRSGASPFGRHYLQGSQA